MKNFNFLLTQKDDHNLKRLTEVFEGVPSGTFTFTIIVRMNGQHNGPIGGLRARSFPERLDLIKKKTHEWRAKRSVYV